MKITTGLVARKTIKWAVLFFLAIITLGPFFWMVSTSFKPSDESIAFPPTFLPEDPVGFKNYYTVLTDVPFFRFYYNSLVQAITATVGALFTSSLAGYIFAKFWFKGQNILFMFILSTLMVPLFVIIIPIFLMIRWMNLVDSLWALIIPGLASAFGIFLMRQFMKSIPFDFLDAGRIDGCGEFGIFARIIVPLSRPAFSALGIFHFMIQWDSFIWPLVVIENINKRTLPLGLALFTQQFGTQDYNLIMAAAVLAVLPVIVVFLFAQRSFIEGITLTGIKG